MRLALRSLLALVAAAAPVGSASAQGFPLVPITGTRVACAGGAASVQTELGPASFPCRSVDLMAFLPLASIGGAQDRGATSTATIATTWGWTDPQTGHEIALLGRSDGTAFVDVTDPLNPVYLGLLPRPATRTNAPASAVAASQWRELKVLGNTMVVVSEASGHGMQTFDLTRLRGVTAPQVFSETGRYTGFGRAHNVLVSDASTTAVATGFASDGTARQPGCGQGLEFVSLANPAAPAFVGCFNGPSVNGSRGYTHDAQCVTYHGPDTRFAGREICLLSDEKVIHIVDATNKASFQVLGSATYPNVGYAHQGWLSDDHRTFYFDDEFDETNGTTGGRTRTLLFDVARLDAPVYAGTYAGRSSAIDHNQYVRGRLLYQANYTAGIAILDVTAPLAPTEAGFFDTYPANDNATYNGIWNVYPYFASGTVVAGGIGEGLFVLRPTGAAATASEDAARPTGTSLRLAGPNPAATATAVEVTAGADAQAVRVVVYDALGREARVLHDGPLAAGPQRLSVPVASFAAGAYTVRLWLDGRAAGIVPLVVVR